ncbi:hypothetical protein JL720_15831 [Aureococcus anophagefferens]|nr:hypothetical protein JL720_15831 [Aureococcus anophagefferens]
MTTHALLTPSRSAETRATWQALRKGDMATATRVTADVAAIEESVSAPDGTLKLLVRLADGADVEAVVIPPSGGPAKKRATGDNGASRDAVAALVDGARFAYGRDRVTVSTVGPAPGVFAELFGYAGAGRRLVAPQRRRGAATDARADGEALGRGAPRRAGPRAGGAAGEAAQGRPRGRAHRGRQRRAGDAGAIAAFVKPIEAACTGTAGGRTGVLVNLIPYNANESVDPSFEPPPDAVQAFQARLRTRRLVLEARGARRRRRRGLRPARDGVAAEGPAERPPLDHTSRVATPASIALEPIGVVRSPYTERFGTPRQPTVRSQTAGGGGLVGTIELRPDLAARRRPRGPTTAGSSPTCT